MTDRPPIQQIVTTSVQTVRMRIHFLTWNLPHTSRSADQGNRTLKRIKSSVNVIEDVLVPSCAEPFVLDVLVDHSVALENCQRHPAKCTGDFRA